MTIDRPVEELVSVERSPGTVCSAFSIGSVTSLATTSAEAPSCEETTTNVGISIEGMSSCFKEENESVPKTAATIVIRAMRARFFRLRVVSLCTLVPLLSNKTVSEVGESFGDVGQDCVEVVCSERGWVVARCWVWWFGTLGSEGWGVLGERKRPQNHSDDSTQCAHGCPNKDCDLALPVDAGEFLEDGGALKLQENRMDI